MSKVTHALPARNARRIFTAAEDFRVTYEAIVVASLEGAITPEWRSIGPQMTVAAFTIELYLKCILVDGGAKTYPASHNLLKLYSQLPTHVRAKIKRRWPELIDSFPRWKAVFGIKELFGGNGRDVQKVLSEIADTFDQWRYRFEHRAIPLYLLQGCGGIEFIPIHKLLRGFILERRPEWEKDDDQEFLKTFLSP